tara:strand:+ start:15522 stop:16619 length:1098 start_codon:yes stop_codon:yes gene_type:complete
MKVKFVNLKEQWNKERKDLLKIIDKALNSGDWVGGKNIQLFEKKISKICNTKYAVALNSGTDALTLALYSLGVRKGDEVITTSNSFVASVSVIVHLGAKPVFVDVLPDQTMDTSLLEKTITKKTKAIMPVHLTGRVSEMNEINRIAKKYDIPVIEDAAQSIGSKYYNKPTGSLGKVGCFSAHPLKNLNAIGDGGYLTTNDTKIYKKVIELRNHGMINRNKIKNFGHVSRLDNLQAAVLNFRLKNLQKIIGIRRNNFNLYKKFLNRKFVFFPDEKKHQFNTYHTFVVQVNKREHLIKFLKKNKISTAIHYPIPIHLQPAAKYLKYKKGSLKNTEKQAKKILTLPINQYLKPSEIKFISNKINYFFK